MNHKFNKSFKYVIICLAAEKLLEQVEWEYLLPLFPLMKIGHGPFPFTEEHARLFALAIEPLAISIRGHDLIKPIPLGGADILIH